MTTQPKLFSRGGAPLAAAPFILSYTVAALVGLRLLSPTNMSLIWPANAIVVAGLLLLDRRARLYCVVGCWTAIMVLTLTPDSVARALGLSTLSIAEFCIMAVLTRLVCGPSPNFSDGRKLFAFVVGAALPACTVSALGLLLLTNLFDLPVPPGAYKSWFVSHTLGAAMVAPAVMVIAQRRRFAAASRSMAELVGAMAILLAFCVALFWWQVSVPLLFLIFPAMMLVAFRYGPVGAGAGSLLVGAVAALFIYAGMKGITPELTSSTVTRTEWMQFFVAAVFLTTLPAAGAVASYARMRTLLARRTQTARIARRRAAAAAAAKGEFLANMSHEIRTPLNGVIGLADALSRTKLAPDQAEMLKMILNSGKALTGLLSDALDLARADSGALKLTREPFDIREATAAAALPFETLARNKGLDFRLEFDLAPPGAVIGDALRIRQVISNLISNAVKFTAAGSVATSVSLKPGADDLLTLRVSVRDTGVGFDDEVKTRLFKRFEQGDSSVTRRFGGSGLGLSIAHRLAEMMAGEITCESSPGLGSVFNFAVDLNPAAAPAVSTRPAGAPSLAGGRPAVLLAEDHPVNRKVIQAMLGDTVALTQVEDGQAAVEAFAAGSFDIVLMDTHMPVMDGLAAIRAIRALERDRDQPRTSIVSLTADAMPQQIDASLAAGADLHLAKPVTGDSLFAALQACLGLREAAEPRPLAGAA